MLNFSLNNESCEINRSGHLNERFYDYSET